ncbi:MAG: HDIG domain-containing protein [Tannerella sp.]|nr:HDIG domain-containing protein [Tannerella sp.]
MNPLDVIARYGDAGSAAYRILIRHSRSVADKALSIARAHPEIPFDLAFLEEAAMLHDIGIFLCHAPEIDCHGPFPYICHGYLGAGLMRREGLPRHALVCERHTGTGLSPEMIHARLLPVPFRDMQPQSDEEQLICFADKFFSKTKPDEEKTIDRIRKGLSRYGPRDVARFDAWCKRFLGM